jgi:hypothetical protein
MKWWHGLYFTLCLAGCKHLINISSFSCLRIWHWSETTLCFMRSGCKLSVCVCSHIHCTIIFTLSVSILNLGRIPTHRASLSLEITIYTNMGLKSLSFQCLWSSSWPQLTGVREDAYSRLDKPHFFSWSSKWRQSEMEYHWT